ncbi:MAG: glutathione S-transferase N-terminal domain-containing protein [Gammaproteobacteria bacterium]|nr:glutathione S-transferase N-terminal domain-containing protein [Gammaproteobacteria bacterium]
MKLLFSPTSPYVRKVRIVAREKGLLGRISEVKSIPFDSPPELVAANPLGKVPALILEDGSVLFDSPVICEYLDQLVSAPQLILSGIAKWPVLRAQALADGVMDVAASGVMELRRPQNEQSPSALKHWRNQIRSAVSQMHKELTAQNADLTLGHIAMATALSYLDFRHPDLHWRNVAKPAVVDWHAEFSKRHSMLETAPPV